jgi:hypothetical protein
MAAMLTTGGLVVVLLVVSSSTPVPAKSKEWTNNQLVDAASIAFRSELAAYQGAGIFFEQLESYRYHV